MPELTLFQKVVQYFQDDELPLVLTEADVLFLRTKAPWRYMKDDITLIPALEKPNEYVNDFVEQGDYLRWLAWGLDTISEDHELNWGALAGRGLDTVLGFVQGDHASIASELLPFVPNHGEVWETQALTWLETSPVRVWWLVEEAIEFATDQLRENALAIAARPDNHTGYKPPEYRTGSGENVAACLRNHAKRYLRENYMKAPLRCGHRCGKRFQ